VIRVAHLITGLETGGAERMLARLVTGGDRNRVASCVVSMTDAGALGPLIAEAGVPVYPLGIRRGRPDPRGLGRLRDVLDAFAPDMLQTWLYHADLLGLAAFEVGWAPHLVWNVRCSESVGSTVVRRVLATASRRPDAVIVNSSTGRRFHERLGYRPKRWVDLPNGFDTEALRPNPELRHRGRAALGLASEAVVIALPARLHPMKDHATFLAAATLLAARRPEARFVLIGGGNEPGNPVLGEPIRSSGLGERVLLLGERRDLDALYSAFDIVSLSSAFGEGFPNVLGEAMACGVPCVATDTGDAAEIVGETGIIVPPGRPAALADAWDRLIAQGPEGRGALGMAARARIVSRYGLAAIVSRYEALYAEIAAGQ